MPSSPSSLLSIDSDDLMVDYTGGGRGVSFDHALDTFLDSKGLEEWWRDMVPGWDDLDLRRKDVTTVMAALREVLDDITSWDDLVDKYEPKCPHFKDVEFLDSRFIGSDFDTEWLI
ncbi:MAG: hypothetical protein Q4G50_10565 [Corynebacterium sp.]|uniref:hypothetical protein n=1 Tax=Corynebacterium sp. TaxID=1720 RepID=UPI0026DF1D8A|nr:hypothetical protein [Corynebacterium sp.]MDO5670437.1 hypothetical protein [Corynebacterium sp.]